MSATFIVGMLCVYLQCFALMFWLIGKRLQGNSEAAVKVITSQHQAGARVIPLVPDYEGGPVSLQVVRVVLSYTDYVNRTVWRKD